MLARRQLVACVVTWLCVAITVAGLAGARALGSAGVDWTVATFSESVPGDASGGLELERRDYYSQMDLLAPTILSRPEIARVTEPVPATEQRPVRVSAPTACDIDLEIVGPEHASLGCDDWLEVTARLTNRSSSRIEVIRPVRYRDIAGFEWEVTEAGQRVAQINLFG